MIFVKEHHYYDFQIAFQGATTGPSSEARIQQMNELKKFVGDGGFEWVTTESADTETPVVFSQAMNAQQQHQMMQSGQYVARMTRSGVMIPVHLVIKVPDANGSIAILYDKTIETWNFEAGSGDGILRPTLLRLSCALVPTVWWPPVPGLYPSRRTSRRCSVSHTDRILGNLTTNELC